MFESGPNLDLLCFRDPFLLTNSLRSSLITLTVRVKDRFSVLTRTRVKALRSTVLPISRKDMATLKAS